MISSVAGGNYVKLSQTISYVLTPTSAKDPINFRFGCTVYKKNTQDNTTSVKVTGIRVGENDWTDTAKFEPKSVDGKEAFFLLIEKEVKGAPEYRVFITVEAVWDVDFDPYESFTVTNLVNNLRVTVNCTDDLSLEWFDLGVKDGFKDIFPHDLTKTKIQKEYIGLIFKQQGYRFAIRKAEVHA